MTGIRTPRFPALLDAWVSAIKMKFIKKPLSHVIKSTSTGAFYTGLRRQAVCSFSNTEYQNRIMFLVTITTLCSFILAHYKIFTR